MWADVALEDVRRLAALGAILRSLAAISWESRSLGYHGASWAVRNIDVYRRWLARAIGEYERERGKDD